MVEPINLNRARKAHAKAAAVARAAENRVRFGRTKAQCKESDNGRELADRRLEAHRRDPEAR